MDELCVEYGIGISCDVSLQVLGPQKDRHAAGNSQVALGTKKVARTGAGPRHDVLRMPWLIPLLQQRSGTSAKLTDVIQMETSAKLFKMTVMWRNLPNDYSRDNLLSLIDDEGFAGSYDFFYAPYDFANNTSVGYALIHFVSIEEANRFFYHFQGFSICSLESGKLSEVTWSQPPQDLKGHIERYRNSPVMHRDVSDDKKPILLRDGSRIPFPVPTRRINAPRLRQCGQA